MQEPSSDYPDSNEIFELDKNEPGYEQNLNQWDRLIKRCRQDDGNGLKDIMAFFPTFEMFLEPKRINSNESMQVYNPVLPHC
mmetsp:Transcript_25073/g.56595  ORF Transcript_25073/g.56595 Transcript_25073/m.56595 type:complete len:82 (+) Transcript_25073:300-545(+)